MNYIEENRVRVVSFVGAGGKTSTVFALNEVFKRSSQKRGLTLVTTTTAMHYPKASEVDEVILCENRKAGEIIEKLKGISEKSYNISASLGVFQYRLETEDHVKVKGIEASLVDRINEEEIFDIIMVEADGAKRKSMKAYETHEPVIPNSTDLVIVLMGLSVLGKKAEPEIVHRLDSFLNLTGKSEGDIIELKDIPKLFRGEMGFLRGVPEKSGLILFLNQWDAYSSENLNELDDLFDEIMNVSDQMIGILAGSIREDKCYKWHLR